MAVLEVNILSSQMNICCWPAFLEIWGMEKMEDIDFYIMQKSDQLDMYIRSTHLYAMCTACNAELRKN